MINLEPRAIDHEPPRPASRRDRRVASGRHEVPELFDTLVWAVLLRVRNVAGRRHTDVDGCVGSDPIARLGIGVDGRPFPHVVPQRVNETGRERTRRALGGRRPVPKAVDEHRQQKERCGERG